VNYSVEIHSPAQKSLRNFPDKIKDRVSRSMLALGENPRPVGTIKLSGRDAWRIRVGDYRVIYTIDDSLKTVTIFAIGHRREIYR
jgi:mRNA interferase RelE/StbE